MTSKTTIIIGAGLSGLIVANRLQRAQPDVLLIEKSRGVGGRMATRRADMAKFDHGAQFYSLKSPLKPWHDIWLANALVLPWFETKGTVSYRSPHGMTALAKHLALGLNIKLATRVTEIFNQGLSWRIRYEDQTEDEAARVILTCPLPQSLEILQRSNISYDLQLENVRYAKAIVALIEPLSQSENLTGPTGYRELKNGPVLSIADQQTKGLSMTPSMTVTLKPEASESLFDLTEDAVSETIVAELKRSDPSFAFKSVQIKKWRFAHPLSNFGSLFASPTNDLFLAGDAFGGPSLNGAARSAEALADFLIGPEAKFDYRAAILEKLSLRSSEKTMCPSEVLREDDKTNKAIMEHVRNSARLLAQEGKIEITQKGERVDPQSFRGPIRLRLK